MTDEAPLVECVPNVSEGRNTEVIDELRHAIATTPDVHLLHVDRGYDAHRTVFTFAGPPEAVADAAIALGHGVARLVDMRRHQGGHPRIGALDVCPFVPIRHCSLSRCGLLARRVASSLAHDLDLPVYLYEAAAYRSDRRSLVDLRRGGYEAIAHRMRAPADGPDFGPQRPSPRLGASVVGARPFLIAWNVSLETGEVAVARRIAGRLRTSGVRLRSPDGRDLHLPGRLPALRAIGWAMPTHGVTQVSMNLLDYHVTPLHAAWTAVCEEAAREGTRVLGSELVGLVPLDALAGAGRALLGHRHAPDTSAVEAAVDGLGLAHLAPFDPRERVLEWRLATVSAQAEVAGTTYRSSAAGALQS